MGHIGLGRSDAKHKILPSSSKGQSASPAAICFLCLTLLLSPGQTAAQSTYGTLQGTVTDTAGAAVPAAKVVAINEATGAERDTTSDAAGDYRLVNLDPGSYSVTVSAANFGSVKDEHISLPSRETVRADIQLAVKSVQQEVVVDAKQDIITEELTQSNSLSGGEISSLPLNFRATSNPSPIQAAVLTTGVSQDPGGNLTFAGQVPTATSFSLDGISISRRVLAVLRRICFPRLRRSTSFG